MNVLITGGAGYLGSVLARLLLEAGHHVRILDSLLHGGYALSGLYLYDNFSFQRGDVRSEEDRNQSIQDIDTVVHLAAIVGDPACARQPEIANEVNLEASLALYQLCQHRGIERFIFSSTCSNYGKMSDPSDYVNENSDLNPVSLYAETKIGVERHLLDTINTDGPATTVLRFATLFGLSPRMRFDLTVNTFTRDILVDNELEVYGEQFWRPYIHVLDAARAIALVLDSPKEKTEGRVFNVGDTGENYQKGQLASLINSRTRNLVNITHVERTEDPRDYRVSFNKIREELGFQITRTVSDGVDEIADAINQGVLTDLDDPRYSN